MSLTDMPKELVPTARGEAVGPACSRAAGAPWRGTTGCRRCLRRQSPRVDATYGFACPRCITGGSAPCLAACAPQKVASRYCLAVRYVRRDRRLSSALVGHCTNNRRFRAAWNIEMHSSTYQHAGDGEPPEGAGSGAAHLQRE